MKMPVFMVFPYNQLFCENYCLNLGCSSDEDEKNMIFRVINLCKVTYFNSDFYS